MYNILFHTSSKELSQRYSRHFSTNPSAGSTLDGIKWQGTCAFGRLAVLAENYATTGKNAKEIAKINAIEDPAAKLGAVEGYCQKQKDALDDAHKRYRDEFLNIVKARREINREIAALKGQIKTAEEEAAQNGPAFVPSEVVRLRMNLARLEQRISSLYSQALKKLDAIRDFKSREDREFFGAQLQIIPELKTELKNSAEASFTNGAVVKARITEYARHENPEMVLLLDSNGDATAARNGASFTLAYNKEFADHFGIVIQRIHYDRTELQKIEEETMKRYPSITQKVKRDKAIASKKAELMRTRAFDGVDQIGLDVQEAGKLNGANYAFTVFDSAQGSFAKELFSLPMPVLHLKAPLKVLQMIAAGFTTAIKEVFYGVKS